MPSSGWRRQQFAHAVEQVAQLLWARDVAAEDDHAARLNFLDQLARFGVEFSAGKSDVEKLSDLLFEWEAKGSDSNGMLKRSAGRLQSGRAKRLLR